MDVNVAGTFSSRPGVALSANVTYTNADMLNPARSTLGRSLNAASTITVNVLEPNTMLGDRIDQLDIRVGKILRFGQDADEPEPRYRQRAQLERQPRLQRDVRCHVAGADERADGAVVPPERSARFLDTRAPGPKNRTRPYDVKSQEGPADKAAPLFVLTRTHFPRLTVVSGFSRTLLLCASIVWPSHAYAQAKDAFVEGLTQLINAVDGTFGDEGPALQSAVEAMTRGLAQWDERVALVEAGFRADVANAAPPAAARMRGTLGTVYLERGRAVAALEQFDAAATLDPSLSQVHVFRAMALDRLESILESRLPIARHGNRSAMREPRRISR